MEFKSLKNIETSFRQIRLFCIVLVIGCAVVAICSVVFAFRFAEKQREKIYVLDGGKSLMLALSQDLSQNRPAEAREHVRRFHELFFTLSPEKSAIEHNVKRALLLADKSAYNYYQDFAEKGFYNRLIAGNINQSLQVDSVVCNFDNYPYQAKTYARQVILRESNVTERSLVTVCRLVNATRSDDNPNGFYMLYNHYQVNVYQKMINFRLFLLPLQPNFIHRMAEYSINRIRVVLAEQNKTNRWLAEQMGKSEITISRWVQTKSQPSFEQLLQVAQLLSISPKDLINDINNNEAKNV